MGVTDPDLKFVVLHHTGVDEPHYDLMFEATPGDTLCTFRLNEWPIAESPTIQLATELEPHRREYLEYEGPVAGNRGEVRRMAAESARVPLTTGATRPS